MPAFAHLPLLLKPDGNGKLSKRDGDRLGFPVFPLEWKDPATGEVSSGYREKGYFADGFVNMLALLGWNPGDNREVMTMEELVAAFSFEKVSKAGAKFDPEKTKWFNQQYLRKRNPSELAALFLSEVRNKDVSHSPLLEQTPYVEAFCGLMQEKAHFVSEFWSLGAAFFEDPTTFDEGVVGHVPPSNSMAQIVRVTGLLDAMEPVKKTDLPACLADVHGRIGRREIVMVFSDFLGTDLDALQAVLERLYVQQAHPRAVQRLITRSWTKIKSGT
jgi:glutamyl-tRNA synthetase